MGSKTWRLGAAMIGLAALGGCTKGDMNPNAAPNVSAPGHGPSDGSNGNTPSEASGTTGTTSTAPGAPASGDGSAGSSNPR